MDYDASKLEDRCRAVADGHTVRSDQPLAGWWCESKIVDGVSLRRYSSTQEWEQGDLLLTGYPGNEWSIIPRELTIEEMQRLVLGGLSNDSGRWAYGDGLSAVSAHGRDVAHAERRLRIALQAIIDAEGLRGA